MIFGGAVPRLHLEMKERPMRQRDVDASSRPALPFRARRVRSLLISFLALICLFTAVFIVGHLVRPSRDYLPSNSLPLYLVTIILGIVGGLFWGRSDTRRLERRIVGSTIYGRASHREKVRLWIYFGIAFLLAAALNLTSRTLSPDFSYLAVYYALRPLWAGCLAAYPVWAIATLVWCIRYEREHGVSLVWRDEAIPKQCPHITE